MRAREACSSSLRARSISRARGRLLGGAALGDVEDRAVAPQPAAGAGDELAAVEHPAHLAVGADDPVLEAERLAVVARVVRAASWIFGLSSGWTMLHSVRFLLAMKFAAG